MFLPLDSPKELGHLLHHHQDVTELNALRISLVKLDHRYKHGNYYLVKERALKPLWRIDKDGLPLLLKDVTLNAYSGQQGSAVVPPAPVYHFFRFWIKQQLLNS